MRTLIALLLIVRAASAHAGDGTYLSCAGHSGLSPKQDLIPLLSRTITANKGPEKGSLFVGDDKVIVEGIPWMLGEYRVCENSDQVVIFSTYCAPGLSYEARKAGMERSMGVLNKVTGEVRFSYGVALFVLTCRKAEKLLK